MEDVLNVYQRPYDPKHPQICLDETTKALMSAVQQTVPMEPGKPARPDFEYQRNGVCSIFLACEPLTGRCVVQATAQHTRLDWAAFVSLLLEEYFPDAEKVVLVMDNLNTHTTGSLYEAFLPEKAALLASRLEIHYTPKHASWLDMAEIELSILGRQCLDRRLGSLQEVQEQVHAWQQERNRTPVTIDWRFTTTDARIKLKRLYPTIK
jgi:DDE superfamily endonuclease